MVKLENHWFKHDITASNDNKIQKLEFKHGLIGYAIFFKLVEVLMLNNGKIEYDLDMLAYQIKCKDTKALEAVLKDFNLFQIEDNTISNDRVTRQLQGITEKSEKARRSAQVRHSKGFNV
jgi:hypothetical protein